MAEGIMVSSSPPAEENSNKASVSSKTSVVSGDTLRQSFKDILEGAKSLGEFAMCDSIREAVDPGLHLNGHGIIGLPLLDHDAEAIIAASHRTPYGGEKKTIVVDRIRKAWELPPPVFHLRNPAWTAMIDKIVEQLSLEWGVDRTGKGARAELDKMLLYDDSAMFGPHQDSGKAPGMFGTLVIALPSAHQGGDVQVIHAGETKTLNTSAVANSGYSYLVGLHSFQYTLLASMSNSNLFSDVNHDVKPVTSGRRLVLTYNLIHTTPGPVATAKLVTEDSRTLQRLCSWWAANVDKCNCPQSMAYLLDLQYTDANLSSHAFKDQDFFVVSQLKDACSNSGVYLCFANLERIVTGDVGNEYDDSDSDDEGNDLPPRRTCI
ncbi:hypothetical protein VTL71DRAFT_11983 [Oculimacula yallundae]|uniref:Fe2OG dioxygenase domain-containing protein n=1 Tax=Oculimacula yallundae TaxID=86028 RepID=A0ABR4CRZ9_9HELO